MKTNPDNRALAVSQKVYGWLLRAYPPVHRTKYGPAMAQLFRDQCRDAWVEARGRGLLKLWLRVLPDLVKTSIIERVAAITERKTMSDKIATLVQPRTIFLKVFAAVFVITVLISVIITYILPETYASTATILLENDRPATNYDPYFIQTQFEVMRSQLVLQPVIEKLNLNNQWGKKYNAGETLKSAETEQILKGRLSLQPVRNTKLVSITVYGDDKMEAAQIANAIADSYKEYRSKLQGEAGTTRPLPTLAQIIDKAEPGLRPVKPNKPLNITLGVICGVLLASVTGGLAGLFAFRFGKRNDRKATAS